MGKLPPLMIFLSSYLFIVLQTLHVVNAVSCSGSSINANGSYAQNRQKLFSTFADKVVAHGGFYNASLGKYPNRVYALAICARGYDQEACLGCVQTLTENTQRACQNLKNSYVWGGPNDVYCLVRSSNHSTFGNLQLRPPVVNSSPDHIGPSKNLTLFVQQWEEMVNRTLEAATMADTSSALKYYSAGKAGFTDVEVYSNLSSPQASSSVVNANLSKQSQHQNIQMDPNNIERRKKIKQRRGREEEEHTRNLFTRFTVLTNRYIRLGSFDPHPSL